MTISLAVSKTTALISAAIIAFQFLGSSPVLSLGAIAIGIIWLTADRLQIPLIYDVLTAIFLLLVATGALFEIPPVWIFAALALFLSAYDLNAGVIRTSGIEENETLKHIENRHLLRTTLTIFMGVGIAAAAIIAEIKTNFAQLFFLGLLLFIGLNFTIGIIQNLHKTPNT